MKKRSRKSDTPVRCSIEMVGFHALVKDVIAATETPEGSGEFTPVSLPKGQRAFHVVANRAAFVVRFDLPAMAKATLKVIRGEPFDSFKERSFRNLPGLIRIVKLRYNIGFGYSSDVVVGDEWDWRSWEVTEYCSEEDPSGKTRHHFISEKISRIRMKFADDHEERIDYRRTPRARIGKCEDRFVALLKEP